MSVVYSYIFLYKIAIQAIKLSGTALISLYNTFS